MEQVIRGELFAALHTGRFQQLTSREVEVLQLLAGGLNNPMIAKRLQISRYTVETHRKHLKRKLEVRSHVMLIKYALAFGLVQY